VLDMDQSALKFAKNLLKLVDKAAAAKELTVSVTKSFAECKEQLAKYLPDQ